MAKGRTGSGSGKGARDALVDAVTQLVDDAKGAVDPLSRRAGKELRTLEKRLARARATETKRLAQLAAAQARRVASRSPSGPGRPSRRAQDVAGPAGRIASLAASMAGSAAGTVRSAVRAVARQGRRHGCGTGGRGGLAGQGPVAPGRPRRRKPAAPARPTTTAPGDSCARRRRRPRSATAAQGGDKPRNGRDDPQGARATRSRRRRPRPRRQPRSRRRRRAAAPRRQGRPPQRSGRRRPASLPPRRPSLPPRRASPRPRRASPRRPPGSLPPRRASPPPRRERRPRRKATTRAPRRSLQSGRRQRRRQPDLIEPRIWPRPPCRQAPDRSSARPSTSARTRSTCSWRSSPGHRLQPLVDESVFLGLAATVAERGHLGRPARAELTATLVRYAGIRPTARRVRASRSSAPSPSAARRTPPPIVHEVARWPPAPRSTSCPTRRRPTSRSSGVTDGLPVIHETLVVDVGGGSSEFCIVDADAPAASCRPAPRIGPPHRPIRRRTIRRLAAEVDADARRRPSRHVRDAPDGDAPRRSSRSVAPRPTCSRCFPAAALDRTLTRERIDEALAILATEPAAVASERHLINPIRAGSCRPAPRSWRRSSTATACERIRVSDAGVREGTILAVEHAGPGLARSAGRPRPRLAELTAARPALQSGDHPAERPAEADPGDAAPRRSHRSPQSSDLALAADEIAPDGPALGRRTGRRRARRGRSGPWRRTRPRRSSARGGPAAP